MKLGRAVLAAALLAAPAFAQKAARPRAAVLRDIKETLDFIPEKSQDPVHIGYRGIFRDLQDQAKSVGPQSVAEVDKRFQEKRAEYVNALFQEQHAGFHDDPAEFKAYFDKRYHLSVVIDRLRENKNIHLTATQLKRLDAWRSQLDEQIVPTQRLWAITNQLGVYRKVADRQGDYFQTNQVALRADFLPKQRAPEAGLSAPPAVQPAAYVQPVAIVAVPRAEALTNFISRVANKAKGYAQKVASAIINSSAARNIDASLTTAIVWAESSFSHTVGSWASCVGLGQLSSGVAKSYGVTDRTDIAQNLKGTTGYLRDLVNHFTTHDERQYLDGLFAQEAVRVRSGANLDETFKGLWPRIPDGMKSAVAAYNAGGPAVDNYGGWDKLPLPRTPRRKISRPSDYVLLALSGKTDSAGRPMAEHCYNRPDQDSSYCQTMDYVPKVLSNYFKVYVNTTPSSPAGTSATPVVMASASPFPSGI